MCFKNGLELPSSTALIAQAIEDSGSTDAMTIQIRDGRVAVGGKQVDPEGKYPVIVGSYVLNTLLLPDLRPCAGEYQIVGQPITMSELIKDYLKSHGTFPS